MPFRRRLAAPLVTIKHIVQIANATVASGAVLNIELIQGVAQSAVTNVGDVVEGSLVKAIHIESWLHSLQSAGASCQQNFIIEKVIGGQTPATAAQLLSGMNGYPNKKNIFFMSQGNMGDLNQMSMPVHNGWLLIPKGKQRFGLGDQLFISFTATGASISICTAAIFKEWK